MHRDVARELPRRRRRLRLRPAAVLAVGHVGVEPVLVQMEFRDLVALEAQDHDVLVVVHRPVGRVHERLPLLHEVVAVGQHRSERHEDRAQRRRREGDLRLLHLLRRGRSLLLLAVRADRLGGKALQASGLRDEVALLAGHPARYRSHLRAQPRLAHDALESLRLVARLLRRCSLRRARSSKSPSRQDASYTPPNGARHAAASAAEWWSRFRATMTTPTTPEVALGAWIERTTGGRVVRIEKLARWREAWDVDVEVDGALLPLHARGERELNFAIPYRIADEAPTHDLLEHAGLPVPHAYGLCGTPNALVMDRLPGLVDLSFADGDDQRAALLEEYLELQAQIYRIDLADAAAAGFDIPTDARGVALGSFEKFEQVYDASCRRSTRSSSSSGGGCTATIPAIGPDPRFLTYDAFQFMFEDGRITGLLDFELAPRRRSAHGPRVHSGSATRSRTSATSPHSPNGTPRSRAKRRPRRHRLPRRDVQRPHGALRGPPLAAPVDTTDLMSHMAWYVNSARWAFEVIADILGIVLAPVDVPVAPARRGTGPRRPTSWTARGVASGGRRGLPGATLSRLARHLLRVEEIGRDSEPPTSTTSPGVLGTAPRPAGAERCGRLHRRRGAGTRRGARAAARPPHATRRIS